LTTIPYSTPLRRYTVYRSSRQPWAFVAGLLSAVVPGAGQLYVGARRRAALMLGVTILLVFCGMAVALQDEVSLLRLAVQPNVLIALLVFDVAVFVFRAHCTIDAYRCARRARTFAGFPSGARAWRAAAVLVLVAFVAAPHAGAGYYLARGYDVLTSVFAAEEPVSILPTGGGPTSGPSAGGVVTVGENREATPHLTARPEPAPSPWRGGRVTFLLVGGDAGPYRYGLRTDTMIVVSVSTKSGRAAIFGVPRNLIGVPFPPSADTGLETYPEILNSLWGYAEANPELFPKALMPGPTALKETIGWMLGLRIDYFAAVDLRGFVETVDALGGVTVNVPRHIWDAGVSPPVEGEPSIAIDLEPGRHRLDGRQALSYVRTRWASSDYDRMHRQRCVMAALAQQASVGRLMRAFPKLASTVKRFVLTDIPLKTLPELVELLAGLETKKMIGVSFTPPTYAATWANGAPSPDVPLMRRAVDRALVERPNPDSELGLQSVRTDCG
jgi:polyisoprenyl-teichoic acid--peptidoglycan teichoic acid transferase